MSDGLKDLLFSMRQHPAFPELLKAVEVASPKPFRPNDKAGVLEQNADWIFRSGRQRQHDIWRHTLTEWIPGNGNNEPSQQEKS